MKITTAGTPDKFKVSLDGGVTWTTAETSITGTAQLIGNGIRITFAATTGHTLNDVWKYAAV